MVIHPAATGLRAAADLRAVVGLRVGARRAADLLAVDRPVGARLVADLRALLLVAADTGRLPVLHPVAVVTDLRALHQVAVATDLQVRRQVAVAMDLQVAHHQVAAVTDHREAAVTDHREAHLPVMDLQQALRDGGRQVVLRAVAIRRVRRSSVASCRRRTTGRNN